MTSSDDVIRKLECWLETERQIYSSAKMAIGESNMVKVLNKIEEFKNEGINEQHRKQ